MGIVHARHHHRTVRVTDFTPSHATKHRENYYTISLFSYTHACRGNSQAKSATSVAVLFMVETASVQLGFSQKVCLLARAPVVNTIYSK